MAAHYFLEKVFLYLAIKVTIIMFDFLHGRGQDVVDWNTRVYWTRGDCGFRQQQQATLSAPSRVQISR
jgi:hypothetical protein